MDLIKIRVYGMLINAFGEVLISDEIHEGIPYTKFPGGGLEFGESVPDALVREFKEECDLTINRFELLHVTEQVIESIFDGSQVIGIYYQVFSNEEFAKIIQTERFDFDSGSEQSFRWISLDRLSADDLSFEMDKVAWALIKEKIR